MDLTRALLGLYRFSTTCWGVVENLPLSPRSRSDTRYKAAFEKASKSMTKLLRSFFRSGQRPSHQRPPNVKFGLFQNFSTNWRITLELKELQCCAKAHSIAVLTWIRQKHENLFYGIAG